MQKMYKQVYLRSLSLNSSKSYGSNDILNGAASGKVVTGLIETLEYCNCLALTETLSDLISDITCLKVGEYEYVCVACNLAAGSLGLTDLGDKSRIELHLAVKAEIRCQLMCDIYCLLYLGYKLVLSASLS